MSRMYTVDFENGVIVNVLAVDESQAVKIGIKKGGYGRPEVWESDSSVESFVDTEAHDNGEMLGLSRFIVSDSPILNFPVELKNKLSFLMVA